VVTTVIRANERRWIRILFKSNLVIRMINLKPHYSTTKRTFCSASFYSLPITPETSTYFYQRFEPKNINFKKVKFFQSVYIKISQRWLSLNFLDISKEYYRKKILFLQRFEFIIHLQVMSEKRMNNKFETL
jgi:hypothetical protein